MDFFKLTNLLCAYFCLMIFAIVDILIINIPFLALTFNAKVQGFLMLFIVTSAIILWFYNWVDKQTAQY